MLTMRQFGTIIIIIISETHLHTFANQCSTVVLTLRGRGATGSRGSVDPPLFQVRGPHMDVDPPLVVRISCCMNAADNTFKLSDQWICDRKCH